MHTPTPARPQVQASQTCTPRERHTCWISERMESSSMRLLRTSLCSCRNHMPSREHTCAGVRHYHVVSFACEFTAHNPTCCTNLHELVLLRERVSATSNLLQKGYRLTHGPARRPRRKRQVSWPIPAARFRQIALCGAERKMNGIRETKGRSERISGNAAAAAAAAIAAAMLTVTRPRPQRWRSRSSSPTSPPSHPP